MGQLGRRRKPPRSAFKPGQNSHNGEVHRRGPDLVPRRQVQRGIVLKALTEQELRDIRTGKRVNGTGKRHALLVRGAMFEDMAQGLRRAAYGAAYAKGTELQEAAVAANIVTRLGEHIAEHLDQKPAGVTRSTEFVFSSREPNQEVPPDQGQRQLSPAEEGYEEVREEDAPKP